MVIILVKEVRLVVAVDDLDFGIVFEAKVLNRYGIFYQIANKSMENLCYAYLHCDLLDKVIQTIIIPKVKSLYINMHGQYLQKCMFVKVKNFDIDSMSKR
jgi:hypothetical protein